MPAMVAGANSEGSGIVETSDKSAQLHASDRMFCFRSETALLHYRKSDGQARPATQIMSGFSKFGHKACRRRMAAKSHDAAFSFRQHATNSGRSGHAGEWQLALKADFRFVKHQRDWPAEPTLPMLPTSTLEGRNVYALDRSPSRSEAADC
jgi:hypothetical protein